MPRISGDHCEADPPSGAAGLTRFRLASRPRVDCYPSQQRRPAGRPAGTAARAGRKTRARLNTSRGARPISPARFVRTNIPRRVYGSASDNRGKAMAERLRTSGNCGYCARELTAGGLTRHLRSCAARRKAIEQADRGGRPVRNIYHLRVQGHRRYGTGGRNPTPQVRSRSRHPGSKPFVKSTICMLARVQDSSS